MTVPPPAPDFCTEITPDCPVEGTIYGYYPSIGWNAAFAGFFSLSLVFNIVLAVFAATGSFLFGYDSGVMTIVIQSPHFLKFFNTSTTSATIGAINATFSGGAFFGSLMWETSFVFML